MLLLNWQKTLREKSILTQALELAEHLQKEWLKEEILRVEVSYKQSLFVFTNSTSKTTPVDLKFEIWYIDEGDLPYMTKEWWGNFRP